MDLSAYQLPCFWNSRDEVFETSARDSMHDGELGMNYDIIGDIHGHANALKALLQKLGYRERRGAWGHADRKVIFVGDFIDRGPNQIETVEIARRMVDADSALAVMGNHELNAIAWFLPDPHNPGEYLRPRFCPKKGHKNRHQHKEFLAEVEGTPRHQESVDWFLTLPLWLDLPGLRIVHACWHRQSMEFLAPRLAPGHRLTSELMTEATREPENVSDKHSPEPSVFKAVEALTKGLEIPLPPPHTFTDKDGHVRNEVRVRWWDRDAATYRQSAILEEDLRNALPDTPIPDHVRIGDCGGKPVFFGHYWFTGTPRVISSTVACVDYSIANDGQLVAYRWDGENALTSRNLVSVR